MLARAGDRTDRQERALVAKTSVHDVRMEPELSNGGNTLPSAETERRLYLAFSRGELLDLRPPEDAGGRVENSRNWPAVRCVSAHAIASLLLGVQNAEPGEVAALRIAGARIVGRLDLDGAEIAHRLELVNCAFDQGVCLNDARTRTFSLLGCALPEFIARMTRFDGNLVLGTCVVSYVDLLGSRVDGILALSGSSIGGSDGVAVRADGLAVEGDLFLREEFNANGLVCLSGAAIGGDLTLSNAKLRADVAIDATAVHVKGHLKLGPKIKVDGDAALNYAVIDGQARIENAKFGRIKADRAQFRTDLLVASDASCDGEFRMVGASAVGRIDLELLNLGRNSPLNCEEVQASVLELPKSGVTGRLNLVNAHVSVLKGLRKPLPTMVSINGLTYDSLDPVLPAAEQIGWLRLSSSGYQPQVYEQLAATYRRIGHETDARAVLLAKQRHRRQTLTWPGRVVGIIHDVTAGYGYRSWFAGLWLILLLAVGTWYFTEFPPPPLKAGEHPDFNALAYTFDLLVPLINLGQAGAWNPHGRGQMIAYLLPLLGWLLTLSIVAGITRVLVKD